MKPWYTSKTLWANVVAAVALFMQQQYDYILPPGIEAYALIVVNLVLRSITNKELSA